MGKSLEKRILNRIVNSSEATFIPKDFNDLSDRDQVLRVLRHLINKQIILRVGQGVYTRAKVSSLTKKIIPEEDLRTVAITALQKSGVTILPTKYEKEYSNGLTTQVPTGLVIGVNKRVNKKIEFNGRVIKYEKVTA